MKIKSKFVFLALLILTIFTIFWVYNEIVKNQMVDWDEGNHIYVGNTITQAIRHNNWPQFWQLTLGQTHYPFFQSWYLGFITLPFEYTIESSRLASLFLLIPAVILIWSICRKLNHNPAAGVLAVFFLLTSPNLLLLFSMALKEGLGATLSLLVFFLYLIARQKQKMVYFLLAGLSLLIMMMTKYNFGVLVLAGLGLESFVWLITEKNYFKKNFWLFNLCLYLPLAFGLVLWVILHPSQIQTAEIVFAFQQFMLPGPGEIFNLYETTVLGHLLFYPLELAFAYTFSWLAFLLLTAGFIYCISEWKDYKVRVLSLFFLFSFFSAEKMMVNDQGRYIATCVPFFFIIGSHGLVNLFAKLKKIKLSPLKIGLLTPVLIAAIFILVKDLISFPLIIPGLAAHETLSPVFYGQSYKNINMFNFDRSSWLKVEPKPNMEKIPDVMNFILENIDITKDINLAGSLNEFSPGLFSFYIDKAREKPLVNNSSKNFQQYFAVVLVEDGTRFDTFAYRVFTHLNPLYEAQQVLADKSLTMIKQKEFKDLGIIVTILGR